MSSTELAQGTTISPAVEEIININTPVKFVVESDLYVRFVEFSRVYYDSEGEEHGEVLAYRMAQGLDEATGGEDLGTIPDHTERLEITIRLSDFSEKWKTGNKLNVRVGNSTDHNYGAEYDISIATKCGAPTVVKLDKTVSNDVAVLSWSGATDGVGNAIEKYGIARCESSDGKTWGDWKAIAGSPTTETSISVNPPATIGNYYKYRVRAWGTAGSAFYSDYTESSNTLRRDHEPLEGFADSPLVPGATPVKTLHMSELHDRVNTLRAFYGLSAYAFSPIDERGIAGWSEHVNEIRDAIEGVCTASGKTHEAWIVFSVNCPRADVIEQLRAVVLAL